ncbi:MAG: hypothetical protein QXW00_03095 [Candidatus Woesearchaeota archaeon]
MAEAGELRGTARSYLAAAENILNFIYPQNKNARLFLPALENTFLAMYTALNSLLRKELKKFKMHPPKNDSFLDRLPAFKESLKRNGLSFSYATVALEMFNIIEEHKKSPVEFVRDGKFIICDDKFKTRMLSYEQLKGYVLKTKIFIEELSAITNQNE